MEIPQQILVVDDEPLVTRSCRRVLSEAGYKVETAGSGRDGIRLALRKGFDVVLTDLKMPDLDGMEVVRTLRREQPATAIVVITGYGTIPSAVEAAKLGASDYIEKPFTPARLLQAAAEAVRVAAEDRKKHIQATLVKEVLRLASRDRCFGASLTEKGACVLSGYPLSADAKAAIADGDIAWIEKECGDLSAEEREWLARRFENNAS